MKNSTRKISTLSNWKIKVKPIGKKSGKIVSDQKKSAIIAALLKYEEEMGI